MWNNADIVSRACPGGAGSTKPMAGALVLLVAVVWWGQQAGGGRNSASQRVESGISKLGDNFT